MGEHLPTVVAIAAAAAALPPPRERRCHIARKEEAAEAADFRRRLYVYIPVEDVGIWRSGRSALNEIASQKSQLRRYSLYDSHPSYRIHLRNGIRRGGMTKWIRRERGEIHK